MLLSGGILTIGLAAQDIVIDVRASRKIGYKPLSIGAFDWNNIVSLVAAGFLLGLFVFPTVVWLGYRAFKFVVWLVRLKV
jgi:hypothetical protein